MLGESNVGAWVGIALTSILAAATLWWAFRLFRNYRPSRRGGRLDRLRNPGYIVLIIGFFVMGGVVWQLLDVLVPASVGGADDGLESLPSEPTSPFYPILGLAGDPESEDGVLFAALEGLWRLTDGQASGPDLVSTAPINLYSLALLPDGSLLGSGLPDWRQAVGLGDADDPGEEDINFDNLKPLGLVRSNDGGQTWQEVALAEEALLTDLTVADEAGQVLFARQAYPDSTVLPPGVYRSLDGGGSWEPVSVTGLPPDSIVFNLTALDADTVVVGTDQGLYLGSGADDGDLWEWQVVVADAAISAVHYNPAQPEEVLFYSLDDSSLQVWQRQKDTFTQLEFDLPAGDAVMLLASHPRKADQLFAATFLGELYGSRDGQWQLLVGSETEP